MKNSTRNLFLILAWFSLVIMACNLSSEAPPTMVYGPIAAPTQPTLGYAPPLPGAVPEATAAAIQAKIDIEMFNLVNQVESDRMMVHITTLVGFYSRHVNSSTTSLDYGVGAAYNYIMQQLQTIESQAPENFVSFTQEFLVNFNDRVSTQRNAVAIIRGTEPGAGVIVIGAHYDSRADDLDDAASAAPGAVDNGSGVAALLELARILSQRPHRTTIMFVFFAAEEEGRQGSVAFVHDYLLDNPNMQVNMMINIDTIGSWNNAKGEVNNTDIRIFSASPNTSKSRQLARTINTLGYIHSLNLNIVVQDRIDRAGRYGDHNSFEEVGYPSVRFIQALEDSSRKDSYDTLDGVELSYLADATKTILGVVTSLADGIQPPLNIVLRDSDNGAQTLVWEPVAGASRYFVALRRPGSLIFDQHFITVDPTSGATGIWSEYEAVAIAVEDENGLVGPFSTEYRIP